MLYGRQITISWNVENYTAAVSAYVYANEYNNTNTYYQIVMLLSYYINEIIFCSVWEDSVAKISRMRW